MSRKYTAPLGATSITIGGETFEVKKGIVTVDEAVSHADLISHGYVPEGEEPVAAASVADLREVEFAEAAQFLNERRTELDTREAALAALATELNVRAAELDAREAALAARDVDLAMREHAVVQREAVPPPPPTGDAPAKRGGK